MISESKRRDQKTYIEKKKIQQLICCIILYYIMLYYYFVCCFCIFFLLFMCFCCYYYCYFVWVYGRRYCDPRGCLSRKMRKFLLPLGIPILRRSHYLFVPNIFLVLIFVSIQILRIGSCIISGL